jgi:hypothetical protein
VKISDWIYHVMPGLMLDYSMPERGTIRAGYKGDFAYYDKLGGNDWKNHQGLFMMDYEGPAGLLFGLNNTYTRASDPYGSDTNYKLGVPRTERWINDLKMKLGYGLGDNFKVLGYYSYNKQDYDLESDFTQDHSTNEFGAGVQMRVLPKTWAFLRYYYGDQDFFSHPAGTGVTDANDADNSWHRVAAGLTWDSGAKLSGEFNVGYQWKDYDHTRDPNGALYEELNSWVAETGLTYSMTETTDIGLNVARALRASGASSNEHMKDTLITLTLDQKIMSKLKLSLGVGYGMTEYNLPVVKPKDQDNYQANVGLEYQIQKWLTASLGYKYRKTDANYREDEYSVKQFFGSISAAY